MIDAVRSLAHEHPNALFMPGHGPLANANDLLHYADYLAALQAAAVAAHASGWTADEAAKRNNLASWRLSVLPSYHHKKIIWATAENDARWAYALAGEPTHATE